MNKKFSSDWLERTFAEASQNELRSILPRLEHGPPMRIKYGVDATAPFLHIGHAVNLWAMRALQERGHKVVLLLGDFTTRIGDPTGKSKTRKVLSVEEIEHNAQEFIHQVGLILHTDPEVFEVRRNSEWYGEMQLEAFLSLLSTLTYSRLIQRDMFQERINNGEAIHMHEMLYPILQGYDSVALKSDLTIVGTDQLFNELMGRFYQETLGQSPQVVLTTRITPGIDGREKQSKSLNNYIAITDTPREKYGKIMSLPDGLMTEYMRVYTCIPAERIIEIEEGLRGNTTHPMAAKHELACALVTRYHGEETAQKEAAWFAQAFSQRETPEEISEVIVQPDTPLLDVLALCQTSQSRSALRRLTEQGAVRLNDDKVVFDASFAYKDGDILKIGRRTWYRLRVL